MDKVIKDGKVAILYSPGFGAGWYSWHISHKELLFSPKIVEMVEAGRQSEITKEWVQENLGIDIYAGGASDLKICWLPEGTAFDINEYDGSESICTCDDITMIA